MGRGSTQRARGRGLGQRLETICGNCGGRGHFRDECPSAVFRERGFAISEEVYENYSNEQVGDEEKYEEELHMEDYAEDEVSEEFAAMMTVEYDTVGESFNVSEYDAHTVHSNWIHAAHAI